jgi:hypothetical protein
MTLKSRLAGLVTILLIIAMAPTAFAQVQITIIPDVDNGDINTNNNALAAAPNVNGSGVLVVGSLIAASPLTSTVLRIAYPGPITALANGSPNCTIGGFTALNTSTGSGGAFTCNGGTGVPSNDAIRISGASGVFASVGTGTPLLNTTSQRIEILLPGTTSTNVNSSSGSFRLVGVRLNANGLTGAQTVSASLNTSVNNYLIGSPSTGTVINGLNPGIGAIAIGLAPGNATIGGVSTNPGAGTATIFTNGTVARGQGAFILTEGCASCWRSKTQNSNNGSSPAAVDNSTQIRLTFNNVPAGVTLSLSLNFGTASSNSSLGATITSGVSITSSANTAVIDVLATSLTQIETIEVDYTAAVSTSAAVTTPGAITVTATMFPIGAGVGTDTVNTSITNVPTESAGFPTFTDLEVGPVTLVNIVPANTTMLMPYAITLPPYDTGLAIANTTADPFGSGTGGATKSSGTLTLTFWNTPATGSPASFSLTTSSTVRPGGGLSSDGTLAPGAVWTVLLSQLLTAAGQTGNFTGYVFIQANFLDAHGTATISDFKTYSLTANVLVLPPPATSPRTGPSGGAEQLHF